MLRTVGATFDGKVLRPDEPLPIEANTRVRVTVETLEEVTEEPTSFLRTARSLRLNGPADWATNLDDYLYGDPTR